MAPPAASNTPRADGKATMTEEQTDQQFQGEIEAAIKSCPGQTIVAGATGFAAGGIVGFVTSSMRFDAPILTETPASMGGQSGGVLRPLSGLPVAEQLKYAFSDFTNVSWKTAKTFTVMNAVFIESKCAMEGLRSSIIVE
ncbi:mitochondrial import inner membrane translocase subunit tim22 [Acrodontium crateriforme]|uniref:Mitochondrial import inner membrane translocase subunit TIM22 n=1 Tax=Acrodontium crateriforme TaxID=150365 RepID=A0AAQ3MA17_9PEZI|nr:mitochondrial import inner membrane translocase subunit tim22 [Acrodontium crateriforme]